MPLLVFRRRNDASGLLAAPQQISGQITPKQGEGIVLYYDLSLEYFVEVNNSQKNATVNCGSGYILDKKEMFFF